MPDPDPADPRGNVTVFWDVLFADCQMTDRQIATAVAAEYNQRYKPTSERKASFYKSSVNRWRKGERPSMREQQAFVLCKILGKKRAAVIKGYVGSEPGAMKDADTAVETKSSAEKQKQDCEDQITITNRINQRSISSLVPADRSRFEPFTTKLRDAQGNNVVILLKPGESLEFGNARDYWTNDPYDNEEKKLLSGDPVFFPEPTLDGSTFQFDAAKVRADLWESAWLCIADVLMSYPDPPSLSVLAASMLKTNEREMASFREGFKGVPQALTDVINKVKSFQIPADLNPASFLEALIAYVHSVCKTVAQKKGTTLFRCTDKKQDPVVAAEFWKRHRGRNLRKLYDGGAPIYVLGPWFDARGNDLPAASKPHYPLRGEKAGALLAGVVRQIRAGKVAMNDAKFHRFSRIGDRVPAQPFQQAVCLFMNDDRPLDNLGVLLVTANI